MSKILVVDDDQSILKVIKMRLEAAEYQVTAFNTAKEAEEVLKDEMFDLALLDLKLDDRSGIELMEVGHKNNPEMPVIILTAYGTIDTAVSAMQKGAQSYLTKPFDDRELLLQIEKCLEKSRLDRELKSLRTMVQKHYQFDNLIVKSSVMKRVMEQVAQAANTDSNVYIEGESGTGKEMIAKTLHVASARKDGPFIAVNCSAIPENLLESELFGYERGAFTGAVHSKKGLMVQANKGTFFLDEISEIPLSMQVKLLRVLEEREVIPLGGSKTIKLDVRIIAASNKNIEKEVEEGRFREDLYYRIHVIPIKLSPLRERKEDIPFLAKHFLQMYCKKMNKKIDGFTQASLQKLLRHQWPGNVRELKNAVECSVAMGTKDMITEDLLLPSLSTGKEGGGRDNENGEQFRSLKDAKEDFERNYIIQLIELTKGNVSQAAKLAGKYRADLYDLLKKYSINPADYRNKS